MIARGRTVDWAIWRCAKGTWSRRARNEECITKLQGRWIIPRLKWALASSLEGLGEIALSEGLVAWTVRLFAAADAVRSAHGYYSPVGLKQPFYDQTVAR